MAELPIAPGQVYIEVEYDYEYKSKDRIITIRQGECYMLVKKTNDDWWQVKKEEGTKAFYVPAQYVREVRKALMPPPKPIPHPPAATGNSPSQSGGALWVKPTNLDLGYHNRSAENLHRHESSYRRSPSAHTASSGHFSPPTQRRDSNHHHPPITPTDHDRALPEILVHGGGPQPVHRGGHGSLPRTRARSPEMARAPLDVDSTQHCDSAGEERPTNDSESGDELSSSSTEHLQTVSSSGQGRSESPVYTNLQELKITQTNLPPLPSGSPLQTLGDWETYKDQNGRHFYHNRSTQERTWKPPRARDASTGNSRGENNSTGESSETTPLSLSPSFLPFLSLSIGRLQPLSSEDTCFSTYSSQSDSQYGSPPRGWSEEMDEHGHTLYVSDYTNEKWLKHVDDQGRPYYYSADGSRSEWELPKYNLSPPQPSGDGPKSRSLDRKHMEPIVLTKWRHSAYVQEPNDKRLSKKRRFRAFSTRLHPYKHKDAPLSPKPPSPDSDSCPSSPKPPASPSEKCGVLNVTKITENGKKVRKNWTSSWTVLQGSTLLFAKGQGGGTSWPFYHSGSLPEFLLSLLSSWRPSAKKRPAVSYGCSGLDRASSFGGGQSKPEFTVDLRGGSVEWASKDKSSKKHVIELKTRQGTELLIQSENDGVINDWYRALQDTISTHAWESDEAIEEDMPDSPGFDKHDKDKEHRDSKKSRAMKTSTSMDASDNKKTRHKLKKFLTRRPTLQAVRDKGYIKDQVFGCSLSSLCHRENSTVPGFVKMCIDHVENSGLCVDGLYRVSGNLAVIQKLRFAVNHDEKVNLADGKWEDIHVTTGALKMYFRELPEPLFTYALFHDFVSAIKIPDYKQRVHSIKELVRQLPNTNHDTMQVLFKHLRKVIDYGEENRMTTQSVAIVFGPTLLRPETETWNMAVHMVYQNQIVELILLEYENIFGR
ncbi:rho GTPase-activating protein 12-like isoform X2 [Seriola lalandi dorsalis]|uniref:rho GTPase-activating protein 12-like isoform X2 n=1 Tax=Seriola lalandi dorsalis TaxID=1841481 RepID=UPI000C6FCA6B|nr:rho GTPase-activating protein 12-like isoform X2 [Seriola lalandi dorsalis]XP_056247982.1 rho GTPase-activating protein 12-like isoform X2 [Seriola aureovittata]